MSGYNIDELCLDQDWLHAFNVAVSLKAQMAATEDRKATQYFSLCRSKISAEFEEISLRNANIVSALERVSGDFQGSSVMPKLIDLFKSEFGLLGKVTNSQICEYFVIGVEGEMSYDEMDSEQEQLLVESSLWNTDTFKHVRKLHQLASAKKKSSSTIRRYRLKTLYAMMESLVDVADHLLATNGSEGPKIATTFKMLLDLAKEREPNFVQKEHRQQTARKAEESKAAAATKRAKMDHNSKEDQEELARLQAVADADYKKTHNGKEMEYRRKATQKAEKSKATVAAKRAKMDHNSTEDQEELARLQAVADADYKKTHNGRRVENRRKKVWVNGRNIEEWSAQVTLLMGNLTLNGHVVTHEYDKSLNFAAKHWREESD